ncbi:hypothetical protein AB0F91_37410 [Amycolatopsis sp. NPDC023774]|uniref:hypothetical protein n=1 Tax=Amycolatopsis sp. NPDC023774 TaxID=3155015 RepID=UPI0033F79E78
MAPVGGRYGTGTRRCRSARTRDRRGILSLWSRWLIGTGIVVLPGAFGLAVGVALTALLLGSAVVIARIIQVSLSLLFGSDEVNRVDVATASLVGFGVARIA